MERACKIEQVELENPGKTTMTLPAKILARPDLALVAAGSLSCLRALYRQAAVLGKEHQFFYCVASPVEYAVGSSQEKLREQLQKALEKKGTGGVILYASCLEVLTGLDFAHLRASLRNPKKIPVEILYRGPMVTRYQKPAENLTGILKRMPETEGRIEKTPEALPPALPDFAGIAEFLQDGEDYQFLVTPGGCTGALAENRRRPGVYHLRNSRFWDIQAAAGCEESIRRGIAADYQEKGEQKNCWILGTAVPKLLSFDFERMEKNLQREGIPAVYLPSDGFHSAAEGIAGVYEMLGKRFCRKKETLQKQLNILGAHPLSAMGKERLTEALEYLEEEGCQVLILETGEPSVWEQAGAGALNWVVSAEGLPLAEWMEREWNIPFFCQIPVGKTGLEEWKNTLKSLTDPTGSGARERNVKERKAGNLSALILGDPVSGEGIRQHLLEECGFGDVKLAVYAPLPSQRRWYQKHCRQQEFSCFSDKKEFLMLAAGRSLVLGDGIFGNLLEKLEKAPVFLPIPEPMVHSGLTKESTDYELFGERGAAWLDQKLADCFSE